MTSQVTLSADFLFEDKTTQKISVGDYATDSAAISSFKAGVMEFNDNIIAPTGSYTSVKGGYVSYENSAELSSIQSAEIVYRYTTELYSIYES